MSDETGFEAFVRASTPSLYRTAYLLAGSSQGAEDLLQETLSRLYPKWDRVASADSPVAYVRRSLTNAFISSRRSPAAHDVAVWDLPDRPDPRADPAAQVMDRQHVEQLLTLLPERQRAAVVLRHFQGLGDEEIAAALGCRTGTVRSLISRATTTMRVAHTRGMTTSEATG